MVNTDHLIFRLCALGAPREFILIVLMTIWTEDLYDLTEAYDWMEFFAGNAACTSFARLQGFKGCKFDLKYNPAENVPLGSTNYMDVNSPSGFILAIIFLLKGNVEKFVAWFGIKCSSWTQINVGTSGRCACASTGNLQMPSVIEANKMVERISLLVLLTVALGGCFVLEQPNGSLLEFYPTFRWVITRMFQIDGITAVARVQWWMSAFGASSAKPQYAYSNSSAIRMLRHYVSQTSPAQQNPLKVETARKYTNKQGKECYVGTSQLKDTEIYPDGFGLAISEMIEHLRSTKRGCPSLPSPLPRAIDSFKTSESGVGSGLFDHADLLSAYKYIRGGRHLRIPEEWESEVPKI